MQNATGIIKAAKGQRAASTSMPPQRQPMTGSAQPRAPRASAPPRRPMDRRGQTLGGGGYKP